MPLKRVLISPISAARVSRHNKQKALYPEAAMDKRTKRTAQKWPRFPLHPNTTPSSAPAAYCTANRVLLRVSGDKSIKILSKKERNSCFPPLEGSNMYRYQRAKEKKLTVRFREKMKMQTLRLKGWLTDWLNECSSSELTAATTSLQEITSSKAKSGLEELHNASLYRVEMHIKSGCIEQLNAKEKTTRHPATARIQASLHLISQVHVKPQWDER